MENYSQLTTYPKYTKYCMVPLCTNSSKSAPDKVYFSVPHDKSTRKLWFKVMRREYDVLATSSLFCCEDHFHLEEDTENFMEFKIMTKQEGQKVRLRLRKGISPHKFECQGRCKPTPSKRLCAERREREHLVREAIEADTRNKNALDEEKIGETQPSTSSSYSKILITEENTYTTSCAQTCSTSTPIMGDFCDADDRTENCQIVKHVQVNNDENLHADRAIQVQLRAPYRSKGVNVAPKCRNIGVNYVPKSKDTGSSPSVVPVTDASTSPLKSCKQVISKAATAQINTFSDEVDSPLISSQSLISDYKSSQDSPASDWSQDELEDEKDREFNKQMRSCTLTAIEKEPKMMLGLPKRTWYLIKLLSEVIPLPSIHILITLRKIKLNESFSVLALHFGYSQSTISRIFSKSVRLLAEKMNDLIVWPTPADIFKYLPIAFRARYSNVVAIIDCLEIQIEKPSNPVHQSLTWSQYKKCNTIKYLISCTPDGLVNFISDGYSGRATDVQIVEDCGFLESLPPKTAVMADRGFKDLSYLLGKKDCTLIRPPSVYKSIPSSKEDVKQSKRIAALRIHVERVIGRLREYNMLLPHACVDHNLIPIIDDDLIIVACGLINMQDDLIKK